MNSLLADAADEELRARVREPFESLGLRPVEKMLVVPDARPALLRRGMDLPPTEKVGLLSLVRDSTGVLRWEPGVPNLGFGGPARRAGRANLPAGRVVQQFAFEKIPANKVVTALGKLDDLLTPARNLRQWNPATGKLDPFPDGSRAAGKRVLLLIHGTFSNSENMLQGISAAPEGGKFLADAASKYDLVLTFDHPTVGVSPVMNAFDLAGLLRPLPKELHIVCHSRGGLVTRWFLEAFATDALRSTARAILVGSTIGGTSLASPAKLRSAMDYLATVGETLGRIANLVPPHPFITGAGMIMQVLTSVASFAAKTPVFDAAIALIPGLHGQARIGNNHEISRLRANYAKSGIRYFAVTADFQPKDPGWNFLQYFSKPMQRLANWGADLVFENPNDLVADVVSMSDLADGAPITDVHDFKTTSIVHHTNYFEQPETLAFIRKSLGF